MAHILSFCNETVVCHNLIIDKHSIYDLALMISNIKAPCGKKVTILTVTFHLS